MTEVAHPALAACWAEAGEKPGPHPEALARVRDLESRYSISLPGDFRAYLLETAPAEDLWDKEDINWWSPDRIRNLPEELADYKQSPPDEIGQEPEKWLFFADYLIWCWAWAICCSDGEDRGKVAVIGGPELIVATSFTDFVEQYLRDPVAVSVARTSEETATPPRYISRFAIFRTGTERIVVLIILCFLVATALAAIR